MPSRDGGSSSGRELVAPSSSNADDLAIAAKRLASPFVDRRAMCGIEPGWGPWDGRLVFMGLIAGLFVLVIAGVLLENPAPDGGDGTPRVPTARVVMGRRAYLFPTTTWNQRVGRLATVPWKQLIGPILLLIAGAGFFCLGCRGCLEMGGA